MQLNKNSGRQKEKCFQSKECKKSDFMSVWQNLWNPKNIKLMNAVSILTPAGPTDFFWRYKRMQALLKDANLQNAKIIELGSGSGVMSLKLSKEFNAEITLVDNSENALLFAQKIAKEVYGIKEKKIEYIQKDLFKLKDSKKFDLVHSQGLIEHFDPADKIIEKHIDLAKKNGYVLILAPRSSPAYRAVRKVIEFVYGKWPFGFEKPVEKKFVEQVFQQNNVELLCYKEYLFS
ncbi:MAG: class I SAM-dependent methyltransferase, partial [Candidatus Diapherotrites archaeon]|nr:class I SAM-dependent methyltransferase [Candidatus Diapherotrites archaeon]